MKSDAGIRPIETVSTTAKIGNRKLPDLEEMEQSLTERKLKLEAEAIQLENMKRANEEQKRKQTMEDINSLLSNAEQYETWARDEVAKQNADQQLAENYLQMAREAKVQAKSLKMELGLEVAAEPELENDAEPIFRKHVVGFLISLLVSVLTIWGSYKWMMAYKVDIDKQNASIVDPSLKIGNPYDDSSIQGIIYDNLVQFTDIPKLWLFLLIVCSPIFFYALPVVKTKFTTWTDWSSVSPETRLWLLYAFSATIFLASAIYHVAGSGR